MKKQIKLVDDLLIIGLCTIASFLGPIILIGAEAKVYFIISGLMFSMMSLVVWYVFDVVFNWLNGILASNVIKVIIGLVLCGSTIISLFTFGYRNISITKIILNSLRFDYGLVNEGMISFVIVILIAVGYFMSRSIGKSILQVGIVVCMPFVLMFIFFIFNPINMSSEGIVLFLNNLLLGTGLKTITNRYRLTNSTQ